MPGMRGEVEEHPANSNAAKILVHFFCCWKFGDRFENVGEGNWLLHAYWVRIVVWENEA